LRFAPAFTLPLVSLVVDMASLAFWAAWREDVRAMMTAQLLAQDDLKSINAGRLAINDFIELDN
jgi:hypothetical protein